MKINPKRSILAILLANTVALSSCSLLKKEDKVSDNTIVSALETAEAPTINPEKIICIKIDKSMNSIQEISEYFSINESEITEDFDNNYVVNVKYADLEKYCDNLYGVVTFGKDANTFHELYENYLSHIVSFDKLLTFNNILGNYYDINEYVYPDDKFITENFSTKIYNNRAKSYCIIDSKNIKNLSFYNEKVYNSLSNLYYNLQTEEINIPEIIDNEYSLTEEKKEEISTLIDKLKTSLENYIYSYENNLDDCEEHYINAYKTLYECYTFYFNLIVMNNCNLNNEFIKDGNYTVSRHDASIGNMYTIISANGNTICGPWGPYKHENDIFKYFITEEVPIKCYNEEDSFADAYHYFDHTNDAVSKLYMFDDLFNVLFRKYQIEIKSQDQRNAEITTDELYYTINKTLNY